VIKLALSLPPQPNRMWVLGKQLGVDYVVAGLPANPSGPGVVCDYTSLLQMKKRYEDAGYAIAAIENRPPTDKVKLALPGRDEQIAVVCELIENMGALSIPVWCYEFTAKFGWMRTSVTTRTRGGALATSYDHSLMANAPLTEAGVVSEERLWANFAYYLERIVPVAERAGVKLALHPDDPPISPIRGVGRIFCNVEAFQRAIDMVPSEYNGLTFCQGCFAEMGVNIPETIHHLGDKIFFAHFRNLRGTAARFEETFHDDGDTNMLEAMQAYKAIGFDGPMRPDHVPTMEGDANDTPGYTERGRLFAIGYMKGLMEAVYADKQVQCGGAGPGMTAST